LFVKYVRTLLVPAIMGFGEKWNWWPNLPPHMENQEVEATEVKADISGVKGS